MAPFCEFSGEKTVGKWIACLLYRNHGMVSSEGQIKGGCQWHPPSLGLDLQLALVVVRVLQDHVLDLHQAGGVARARSPRASWRYTGCSPSRSGIMTYSSALTRRRVFSMSCRQQLHGLLHLRQLAAYAAEHRPSFSMRGVQLAARLGEAVGQEVARVVILALQRDRPACLDAHDVARAPPPARRRCFGRMQRLLQHLRRHDGRGHGEGAAAPRPAPARPVRAADGCDARGS